MAPNIRFFSAVILVSPNPAELARFYRDGLGIPLETAEHGGASLHFECELGDLHFAIRGLRSGETVDCRGPRVRLAFATKDLTAQLERLHALGTAPEDPPVDRGFAVMTTIIDPDGNILELTQLSERWLSYIASRESRKRDIVEGLRET